MGLLNELAEKEKEMKKELSKSTFKYSPENAVLDAAARILVKRELDGFESIDSFNKRVNDIMQGQTLTVGETARLA